MLSPTKLLCPPFSPVSALIIVHVTCVKLSLEIVRHTAIRSTLTAHFVPKPCIPVVTFIVSLFADLEMGERVLRLYTVMQRLQLRRD